MAHGRFVAYFRVSTIRQGRSGLGVEAQREAVTSYLNGGCWTVSAEFVEVESGKNNDRPQLASAIAACKLIGAKLVIAKLDRLSRDAHFLLGLQKELQQAGVEFVAADMPNANNLTIGIMAVVAEEERKAISARTKAALAQSKKALGGYRGGPVPDGQLGAATRKQNADAFAARVKPLLVEMQSRGLSLRQAAAELTAKGVLTPGKGEAWSATAVRRVLARVAA